MSALKAPAAWLEPSGTPVFPPKPECRRALWLANWHLAYWFSRDPNRPRSANQPKPNPDQTPMDMELQLPWSQMDRWTRFWSAAPQTSRQSSSDRLVHRAYTALPCGRALA